MTLNDLIIEYVSYLKNQRNYSPETISHYHHTLKRFHDFISVEESPDIADISAIHLRRFLARTGSAGVKAGTIKHYLHELGAFFKYAVLEGHIEENPVEAIKKPKVVKKPPPCLTAQEIARLFGAVDLREEHGIRNLAILKTLYYAGLRDGELVALKLGDLKEDLAYMEIRRAKGNKDRIVPVHSHLKELLKLYIAEYRPEGGEEYLFLNRRKKKLSRGRVGVLVKKYSTLAGLPGDVHAHTLRHTFATDLYRHGVDLNTISELLGHSSLDSTAIYTRSSVKKLADAIEKI